MRHLAFALIVSSALAAVPASANDSIAELGTGGLQLARTDAIAMQKEELSISEEAVSVDYVFRNVSDADVETLVAFPMPDIGSSPYDMPMIPYDTHDDFLGFEVWVDGEPVKPQLEQRAFAVDVEVTAALKANNIPLYPYKDETYAALAKLPQKMADDFRARGIIVIDRYDDGSGWKSVRSPFWTLKSTYWWKSRFPVGKDVAVSHRYTPSVGASVGLTFFSQGRMQGEAYAAYKRKYCMDSAFERAILKAAKESPDGYPQLYEKRISYVLTTGGNWASGTIDEFKLTVDKGEPGDLVSFCGKGVRKTSPTTFEMTARDFNPDRDIDILIVKSWDQARGGALSGSRPERRTISTVCFGVSCAR